MAAIAREAGKEKMGKLRERKKEQPFKWCLAGKAWFLFLKF